MWRHLKLIIISRMWTSGRIYQMASLNSLVSKSLMRYAWLWNHENIFHNRSFLLIIGFNVITTFILFFLNSFTFQNVCCFISFCDATEGTSEGSVPSDFPCKSWSVKERYTRIQWVTLVTKKRFMSDFKIATPLQVSQSLTQWQLICALTY